MSGPLLHPSCHKGTVKTYHMTCRCSCGVCYFFFFTISPSSTSEGRPFDCEESPSQPIPPYVVVPSTLVCSCRMNVVDDGVRGMNASRLGLLLLTLVNLPLIAAGLVIISLHWEDDDVCNSDHRRKWKWWALLSVVRMILITPVVVVSHADAHDMCNTGRVPLSNAWKDLKRTFLLVQQTVVKMFAPTARRRCTRSRRYLTEELALHTVLDLFPVVLIPSNQGQFVVRFLSGVVCLFAPKHCALIGR